MPNDHKATSENDVFPCCGHARPHHELWCEGHPPAPAPNTTESAVTREVAVKAGMVTTCREEINFERCPKPAEFVLWGKLFAPEQLGPRCYDHAVKHTSSAMPYQSDQWAVIDLRPIRRMVTPPGTPS